MKMRRVILSSLLVLAGCPAETGPGGIPSGVPPQYSFLYRGFVGASDIANLWEALPYDSIELERTPCLGECPIYRVMFRKGGEAEYHGTAHVERQGVWTGKIDIFSYGRLCFLIDDLRFRELSPRYAASWTDSATVDITVVPTSNRTRVTVSEYGGVGPPSLWAVQLSIDGVAESIDWEPSQ